MNYACFVVYTSARPEPSARVAALLNTLDPPLPLIMPVCVKVEHGRHKVWVCVRGDSRGRLDEAFCVVDTAVYEIIQKCEDVRAHGVVRPTPPAVSEMYNGQEIRDQPETSKGVKAPAFGHVLRRV